MGKREDKQIRGETQLLRGAGGRRLCLQVLQSSLPGAHVNREPFAQASEQVFCNVSRPRDRCCQVSSAAADTHGQPGSWIHTVRTLTRVRKLFPSVHTCTFHIMQLFFMKMTDCIKYYLKNIFSHQLECLESLFTMRRHKAADGNFNFYSPQNCISLKKGNFQISTHSLLSLRRYI